MAEPIREVERWQWHSVMHCVVEIIRTGHYMNTVVVKLPDDSEVETDLVLLFRRGLKDENVHT
jgi:hypothetical protein